MSINLFDWQKRVVYGTEPSLAVPAGVRSGKNMAVVHAMKERKTLVLVPKQNQEKLLMRESRHYGVDVPCVEVLDDDSVFVGIDFSLYEQVIFHEMSIYDNMKYDKKLKLILDLRESFKGRIVVIGTPRGLPDPIFAPLIKEHNWPYIQARTLLSEDELQAFKIPNYGPQYRAQFA